MRKTATSRKSTRGGRTKDARWRGRPLQSESASPLRFVTSDKARVEYAPWGKHSWLSDPKLTGTAGLALVRVTMPSGTGHQFHTHPELEEIIYVIDGVAEQWVDREKCRLKAGEIAFIPKGVVHATHNSTKRPLTFLAILSPATSKGPFIIDCYNEEPWRSLRTPIMYCAVDPRTGKPVAR